MNEDRFTRQLDFVTPEELDFGTLIIGAGGIGSWTTLSLAKMGCKDILLVDFDSVEEVNIPSQFYKTTQIGQPKVKALAENIKEYTGTSIIPIQSTWENFFENPLPANISMIISCLDSMDSRVELWKKLLGDWVKLRHFNCYIDARMGGELMRILVVNPYDIESVQHYKKQLYPSSNASQDPCTAKSIVYNTFFCGGVIANTVKKYAKRQEVKYDFFFDIYNTCNV